VAPNEIGTSAQRVAVTPAGLNHLVLRQLVF
jgi:hypothetical protein